jgi:ABC-type Fe3+-hydroxamate transport system substrate-binding protein
METIERSKRDKFLELANKRVSRALKDIKLVGNLANRKNYEYSEDEAKKIIKALQSEVDRVKQQFQTGAQSALNKFEL